MFTLLLKILESNFMNNNLQKLNHRITIQEKQQISDNGGGDGESIWIDKSKIWSALESLMQDSNYLIDSKITHKLIIRYNNNLKPEFNRIIYKDRIFEIRDVFHINEMQNFTTLYLCEK